MRNNMFLDLIKKNPFLNLKQGGNEHRSAVLSHFFNLDEVCQGVRSVNVTKDNRYLIITFMDGDGRITVLDLVNLAFLPHKYSGHTDSVRQVSITSDNKSFYSASWDGTCRKYDIDTGKCKQVFGGFGRSPSCFIDQEQKYLFTASYDSDIDLLSKNTGRCWDLSLGRPVSYYKHLKERRNPECIDIAYDQEFVYTGSDDGIAFRWNFTGGSPVLKYFECKGAIRKVAVTSKYFAAACSDGYVRVHDKFSGSLFRCIHNSDAEVMEVRISKDESRLFTGSMDGSVKCFDLLTGEMVYQSIIHKHWIWSICLMADEKLIVTGSADGSVAIIFADTGQLLAHLYPLIVEQGLLITCQPDKAFPDGFFYTNCTELVRVSLGDYKNGTDEILDLNDPRRLAYIEKLNLKDLVITRITNNRNYSLLTNHFLNEQEFIDGINIRNLPKALNISSK
jgi:WD40 repeat protein